jgi:hypothetical protein
MRTVEQTVDQQSTSSQGQYAEALGTAIGAIGGAAISAIGNWFGNRSNRKASREAFERESKFAREERLAQQQWIEQMYEKNNSYNSPAAQMQRLRDAGLNPDLMYSRGDVGNATAPEAPAQAPTPRYNVIPTYLSSYSGTILK